MIKVYSKHNCTYCTQAKYLLNSRAIPFQEQVLDEDFTRDFILETFPNARTYPIIEVNGEFIGGFDQLKALLEDEQAAQQLICG